MLNTRIETAEEKQERIFQFYKNDLIRLSIKYNRLRFNSIEYFCSFPKINPYEMAASIIKEGITIVYDDSSISREENRRKERQVKKLLV